MTDYDVHRLRAYLLAASDLIMLAVSESENAERENVELGEGTFDPESSYISSYRESIEHILADIARLHSLIGRECF